MTQANDPALARLVERVEVAVRYERALEIVGGDTKRFYGEGIVGEPLDVSELRGISSHEPSELVVTVRAGTPLVELEAALANHKQCLAFEPPRFGDGKGTVGGMIASGLSGPARASVGSVRDFVLGATLLNGRGEVLTFGGQVMKNVAGYDVSRLLAGSLGVFGVICEVSLKVLPLPAATRTLCFELVERDALMRINEWAGKPLPITASAWYDGCLYVRLSGADAAVKVAATKLGSQSIDQTSAMKLWSDLRDHRHEYFSAATAALPQGETVWRLSVPSTAKSLQLPGKQLIEWGGAQRWWRTGAPANEIREAAARAGGHATLFYANDKSAGVFSALTPALHRLHVELKNAFDPKRIFNRGRMFKDL